MSFVDFKIWKKLTGAKTVTTIDVHGTTALTSIASGGMHDQVTLSNPGTTYGTVLEVTGRGYLLTLKIEKPTTVNSVSVLLKITLDGTVVATDLTVTLASTSARHTVVVGQLQVADSSAPFQAGPVFLPFNRSLKVEAKYSGTPGGSEDITADVFAVYN